METEDRRNEVEARNGNKKALVDLVIIGTASAVVLAWAVWGRDITKYVTDLYNTRTQTQLTSSNPSYPN